MPISEEHPELFHYTGIDAVKGIIKNNSIWATHYRFLNDAQEVLCLKNFLKEYCKEELGLFLKGRSQGEQKNVMESFPSDPVLGLLDLSVDTMQGGFVGHESAEPYIASFCTPGDEYIRNNGLLSQWRGYANGGYALVFDTKKMEELIHYERYAFPGALALPEDQLLKMGEAVYDENELCKKYPKEIKSLKEYILWLTENRFLIPQVLDQRLSDPEVIEKMQWEWMPAFMRCAALFKHEGFREEREVRIVAFLISERYRNQLRSVPKDVKVSSGGKPYLELFNKPKVARVKERYPADYMGIKRIIVGPGYDMELRVRELKEFLIETGKGQIEVVVSKTPYVSQPGMVEKKDVTITPEPLKINAGLVFPTIKATNVFVFYKNRQGLLIFSILVTIIIALIGILFSGWVSFCFSSIIGIVIMCFLPSWREKTIKEHATEREARP